MWSRSSARSWALALALASPVLAAPQFGAITPADAESFSTTFALQEGTTSALFIAADGQGGEAQGPSLVEAESRSSNATEILETTWQYDAARRPTTHLVLAAGEGPDAGRPMVAERLSWTPRSLKAAISRLDRDPHSWVMGHDGTERLTKAGDARCFLNPDDECVEATGIVTNNSVVSSQLLAATENRYDFTHDPTQNLKSRQFRGERARPYFQSFPADDSGRNRPEATELRSTENGELESRLDLEWDANGNLIRKGTLRFHYDFRNRLVKVGDQPDGSTEVEVARYEYDAFDRRVRKIYPTLLPAQSAGQAKTRSGPSKSGDTVYEVEWSGWREIEDYVDGTLTTRNLYGLGLDEVVRSQHALDFGGQLDTEFLPVYDHTGNLVVLADENGKPIARYRYSPLGYDYTVEVDEVAPWIPQVRMASSETPEAEQILIEVQEQPWSDRLDSAVTNGDVSLTVVEEPPGSASAGDAATKSAAGKSLSLTLSQPIRTGRQALRRIALEVADPPEPGSEVRLTIAADAIQDLFFNPLAEDYQLTFTWPESSDVVLQDATPPEIHEIFLRQGHLEITLSETPDMSLVSAAFEVDGGSVAWTLAEDTYTLRSDDPLAPGDHTLRVAPGNPFDLAGLGVAELFEQDFTVDTETAVTTDASQKDLDPFGVLVFQLPDGNYVPVSALANRRTFHGRPLDPETGLLYFRHRYYDPQLGRFITPDPMGYVDGSSMYQFAGNNPIDFADPMGLCLGYRCEWASELLLSTLLGVNDRLAQDRGRAQLLIATFQREHGRAPGAEEVVAQGVNPWDRYLTGDGRWQSPRGEAIPAYDELLFVGIGAGAYTTAVRTAGRGLLRQTVAVAGSVADDAAGELIGVNPTALRGGINLISRRSLRSGKGQVPVPRGTEYFVGRQSLGAAAAPTRTGLKGLLKDAGLPTRGRIRFVPEPNALNTGIRKAPGGGFIDRFGNVWRRPRGQIVGEAHWDVQLSPTGRNQLGWASRTGEHLNVSRDGRIVH
jgi:RHS repeat-associated protein